MRLHRLLSALLIGLLAPAALAAQVTISGVVSTGAGAPLGFADVRVAALNLGTLADAGGRYSFVVPAGRFNSGQEFQITANQIGFRPATVTVRLTSGQNLTQNFTLDLDPLRLSEVVATGQGIVTLRERVGSTIATVSGADVIRTNEPNVIAALSGKVSNVRTTFSGGDAGASVAIQIRGGKSFGGSQPTIIIDGVPVNNNVRAGSTFGGGGFGAPAPNRAIDINPEDIESIEILKGAAATSIFGAAAGSAGAILITTKRGTPGRTNWSLRTTYQVDEALRYLPIQRQYGMGQNGISPAGYILTGDDISCATLNCNLAPFFTWGPALPAGTTTYDHGREVHDNGRMLDANLSVSGGTERTTFYLSFGGFDQDGFITGSNDLFKRYSLRFNGSHQILDNVVVGATGSYVQTRGQGIDRGNSVVGIGLSAGRMPPEFNARNYLADNGLHRSYRFPNPGSNCAASLPSTCSRQWDNPYYAINEHKNTQETGRFFGSVNLKWTPLQWLQVNYTLGGDYTSDDRAFALAPAASGTPAGQLNRWHFYDRIVDSNLSATLKWDFSADLETSLTLGQNLNETYFRQVDVTGLTWIAPEPFKLANTTERTPPSDSEARRRLEGYFGQANFDWKDQLFLQGRLRYDGNSAFGTENQRAWYPGASLAWSFTKTLALPENLIDFGKFRFAYGESGQQPGLYQQQDVFTTGAFADFSPGSLQVPNLGGQGGIYPSAGRGNAAIRPERVREFETGFDVSLLKGRVDVGLTRYWSNSSDVIFGVGLPASTGYTSLSLNAGELENKGWEFETNFRAVSRPSLTIEFGGQWATNQNMVVSLGAIDAQLDGSLPMPTKENCGDAAVLPRCQIGFGSSFSGQSTHAQVGYPLGIWRGNDFARCGRGLTTVTFGGVQHNVGAACQGAPDGALYIGPAGYPITDPNTRALGNPQPDWTAGFSTTVTFRGIVFTAFMDHRQGGDVLNMTRASMYQFGTHKDTELRGENRTFGQDWLCQNKTCEVLNGPVVGPGAGTAVPLSQQWFNGGGAAAGQASVGGPLTGRLEDGTNTRLRELSVAYTFRQPWVSNLAGARSLDVKISGRNLGLWTNYSGLDPDTNLGGASNANRGIDWWGTPLSRAWVLSASIHH